MSKALLAIVALLATHTTLDAQVLIEQFKLTTGAAPPTYFGQVVAISGDTLFVGAPWEAIAGRNEQGAVYVYGRVGSAFVFQQKLVASDPAARAFFGGAIAIEGDTAIVGRAASLQSLSPDQARGSAYIFVRQGGIWSEQAKLTLSDAQPRDHFGAAVDISGDTALVAAAGVKEAAYVYVRSGNLWLQQAKLLPNEPRTSFGGGSNANAVALEGDTAIVGAPGDVGTNTYQGSVYVFVRTAGSWAPQTRLTAAEPRAVWQQFGRSVAFSGDTLLVGSWEATSVRVFLRQSGVWSEQAPLPNTELTRGHAVAIEGDTALVSGWRTAPDESNTYFLYVYRRAGTGWNVLGELRPSDGYPVRDWGFDVALGGDVAFAGVPSYPPDYQGAVYVYSIPPGTPGGVPPAPTLIGTVNGTTATLSWSPSAGASSYVLRAGLAPGLSNLADFDTGAGTSFNTTAPPGTSYVRVHARNAAGTSAASNEVVLVVGATGCTTPSAPTALTASVAGSQVSLMWGAATGAASYVLEAGTASGLANLVSANTGAVTTFAASALPGVYYVRVRARNVCGVTGPASNEVVLTIGAVAVPGAPQSVTFVRNGRDVTVSWAPPVSGGAPTHYVVEAGSSPSASNLAVIRANGTSLSSPNTPSGTYYVRVRAANDAGTSAPSAETVVVVP